MYCCGVFLDTVYYFTTGSWYNVFGGKWAGNDFESFDMASGVTTKLDPPDRSGCSALTSSNGTLYDSKWYQDNSAAGNPYVLEIHKRDPTTGAIISAATNSWTIDASQVATYGTPSVTFDGVDDVAYAAFRASTGELDILELTFTGNSSTVYDQVVSGLMSLYSMQYSGGYLGVGDSHGNLFVFDLATGSGSVVAAGLGARMLYLAQ